MSGTFWTLAALGVQLIIVLVTAVVISRRRPPAVALGWILAVLFLPVIGLAVFLVLGRGRLPPHRLRIQAEINQALLDRADDEGPERSRTDLASVPRAASVARLNEHLGALPMLDGTEVVLEPDYQRVLDGIAADIDAAREFVHVEFYLLVLDESTAPVFDAMRRAVERGIAVRVLMDFVACRMYPRWRETERYLTEAGIPWHPMLPIRPWRWQWQRPDLRNHRKIVVIDEAVGWIGSQNLIESGYLKPKNAKRGLHWQDLMMRMRGPAVGELNAVFAGDWYAESGEVVVPRAHRLHEEPVVPLVQAQVAPSGPSFDNDNNLRLFVQLISTAQRRLSITSPYFVPEEATLLALTSATARGVDVELFVSEIGDQALVYHAQRSYYETLLTAGVRIWLYPAPTVLHAKHFSIDDDLAVIGSSNMDIRSFRLNMEVSVLLHGTELVERLRVIEDDYRARSRELTIEEWREQPVRSRILDSLARLTSSLQ